jgi:phage terminase large subunit-like protein
MSARKQPLQVIITTAGYLIEGPCHAFQRDVEKVLSGSVEHEHIFGAIYTIDDGDDWSSEEALAKANPNWGVSVNPDDIRLKVKEALASPREQAKVKTKHANVWVNAKSGWMNMEAWRRCADASLQPEQFAGESCYMGFDLSQTTDITSRAKLFIRDIDGEDHYYIFGDHYLPRDTADLPEKKHYRDWEAEGWLHVTPGNVIDYRFIERDIVADSAQFDTREIGFDKYNATDLVTRLMEDHGLPMIEVPQTTASLSEPMKLFESLVLAGRIHHNGDPVLTYGVSNVVAFEDWAGNIRPGKERGETKFAPKIDPFSAALNALHRAMKRGGRVETSITFL